MRDRLVRSKRLWAKRYFADLTSKQRVNDLYISRLKLWVILETGINLIHPWSRLLVFVPVPVTGCKIAYPHPYPYLWARTRTHTHTHDSSTCWTRTHTNGLVPIPVPIPMGSCPYPYPWDRTRTCTHTHGIVPVPVPIPMGSYPYLYPYPWSRTRTQSHIHSTNKKSKKVKIMLFWCYMQFLTLFCICCGVRESEKLENEIYDKIPKYPSLSYFY